jgi:hypothetical protein
MDCSSCPVQRAGPEKLKIYRDTQAAYKLVFIVTIIHGQTGSLKRLVARIRDCKSGVAVMSKQLSGNLLRDQFSVKDYDLLLAKISQDKGFAETLILKVSWDVAIIGGAGVFIAMMLGGETTSLITAMVNRGPSFVKRMYLTRFDDEAMAQIDALAKQLSENKMRELLN